MKLHKATKIHKPLMYFRNESFPKWVSHGKSMLVQGSLY